MPDARQLQRCRIQLACCSRSQHSRAPHHHMRHATCKNGLPCCSQKVRLTRSRRTSPVSPLHSVHRFPNASTIGLFNTVTNFTTVGSERDNQLGMHSKRSSQSFPTRSVEWERWTSGASSAIPDLNLIEWPRQDQMRGGPGRGEVRGEFGEHVGSTSACLSYHRRICLGHLNAI